MSSKLRLVLPGVVLGLALVGCSDKEPGNAIPGDGPTSAKGSPTSTSSGTTGTAFGDPCSLLKSEDVSKLKLTPPDKVSAKSCQWRASDRTIVRVDIFPDKGIKDYVPGPDSKISDTKIGGRTAKFVQKAMSDTACAYSVEVTEKSRIDVAASGPSLDGSCAASKSVAEAIEPNLP